MTMTVSLQERVRNVVRTAARVVAIGDSHVIGAGCWWTESATHHAAD